MVKFDYTEADIITSLKNVGIKSGDNVFIHSNLGFFGSLFGARNKYDYYLTFKNAIQTVIGDLGTFIVPTFSYSFFNSEIYDKSNTKSVCGAFSEFVRDDSSSIRSNDANFSICAIGYNKKYFALNSPEHSFGDNSFWDKLYKNKGKICNFNFDSGSTFIHYVERCLNVPYRYDKKFEGYSRNGTQLDKEKYYHFVSDLDDNRVRPNFTKFDLKAKEMGLSVTSNLGKGQIVCISAVDTFDLIKSELKIDDTFIING
jgi:aminoglycoside 3-N-acetyltransferase